MKWIVTALVLGVWLNLSSAGGVSWPIGSVVAVVIVGAWLKNNQDRHFEEIKTKLENIEMRNRTDGPQHEASAGEEP